MKFDLAELPSELGHCQSLLHSCCQFAEAMHIKPIL